MCIIVQFVRSKTETPNKLSPLSSKHFFVSSQTGIYMLIVNSSADAKGRQEELTFVFHFTKNFERTVAW